MIDGGMKIGVFQPTQNQKEASNSKLILLTHSIHLFFDTINQGLRIQYN
jgi:hypothetical protein